MALQFSELKDSFKSLFRKQHSFLFLFLFLSFSWCIFILVILNLKKKKEKEKKKSLQTDSTTWSFVWLYNCDLQIWTCIRITCRAYLNRVLCPPPRDSDWDGLGWEWGQGGGRNVHFCQVPRCCCCWSRPPSLRSHPSRICFKAMYSLGRNYQRICYIQQMRIAGT